MSKPLQPLHFVPFEQTELAKVASVIEKLVGAYAARDAFLAANSYRHSTTKTLYDALAKFNKNDLVVIKVDTSVIDKIIFEGDADELQNFFEQ